MHACLRVRVPGSATYGPIVIVSVSVVAVFVLLWFVDSALTIITGKTMLEDISKDFLIAVNNPQLTHTKHKCK